MSFWFWCKECLQGHCDCGVREVIGGEFAEVLTVVYVVSVGIVTVYFWECVLAQGACVREIMYTCTGSMREIMCTFTGRGCEGDHMYLHREHVGDHDREHEGDHVYLHRE